MAANHLETQCPSWLEDECFIIETSGEMPEVAMQEALLNLPPLGPAESACLRAAVARGYLRILHRDLEHANLGLPHFRGLERAQQNLARLRGFLGRVGWQLPPATRQELGAALEAYLAAEEATLAAGRGYAGSQAAPALSLLQDLEMASRPWRGLLARLDSLPVPDFRGLTALRRLEAAGRASKRRRQMEGALAIEVLGAGGDDPPLAGVVLPLTGPDGHPDPAGLARAELVWSLLDLPEA
ncbi:MAG: hypothetical protein V1806_15195 [Pseudomonadota bacterium]